MEAAATTTEATTPTTTTAATEATPPHVQNAHASAAAARKAQTHTHDTRALTKINVYNLALKGSFTSCIGLLR